MTVEAGRTMVGHVVVSTGAGEDGKDAIAVWHVSIEGVGTGAWVVPATEAYTHPEVARGLLNLCARRSVTGWEPDTPISALTALEDVARVETREWAATAVALPAVLTEIGAVRSAYDKRIAAERQDKKNIVAPEWKVDIPDPISATAEDLRVYAGLARQPGCPAIQEALLTARLVWWCVQRWKET